MGGHFASDESNRLGFRSSLWSSSDRAWERGKEAIKYILKRGGRMGKHFKVSEPENVFFR